MKHNRLLPLYSDYNNTTNTQTNKSLIQRSTSSGESSGKSSDRSIISISPKLSEDVDYDFNENLQKKRINRKSSELQNTQQQQDLLEAEKKSKEHRERLKYISDQNINQKQKNIERFISFMKTKPYIQN